jgi:hypothetical protein
MQSQHLGSPLMQVMKPAEKRAEQEEPGNNIKTVAESSGLEPRIVELERRLRNISRGMEEFHDDVKSIKYRLAYSACGTAIVLGLLGWIANSRFEQVISLIVSH